jgi:hypothetical protein
MSSWFLPAPPITPGDVLRENIMDPHGSRSAAKAERLLVKLLLKDASSLRKLFSFTLAAASLSKLLWPGTKERYASVRVSFVSLRDGQFRSEKRPAFNDGDERGSRARCGD